jgi:hypothetical protein
MYVYVAPKTSENSFLAELRRTPSRRSSQNSSSPALGEKRSGRAGGWDSVPDRVMASIVLGRGLLAL